MENSVVAVDIPVWRHYMECYFSGTCLIRQTKRPRKCVRFYR